jgi:hypothetical protein
MEASAALSIGGFIAGWLGREWCIKEPEKHTCNCHCPYSETKGDSSWGSGNLVLVVVILLGLVVVFTNTPLALKVTFKDNQSGEDHEVQVAVKGRGALAFTALLKASN